MAVALWFCPGPGTHTYDTINILQQSIQSLFSNSPLFEPHITITSNLIINNDEEKANDDVKKILTYCVAALNSIRSSYLHSIDVDNSNQLISFKNVAVGKKYFNKICLLCNKNKYLYSVANIMREMFVEIQNNEANAKYWLNNEFMPHLSLLYSDISHFSKADERTIITRIEDVLDITLTKSSEPVDSNNERNNIQEKYSFNEQPGILSWGIPGVFKIVRCVGPVEEWEVLGKVEV